MINLNIGRKTVNDSSLILYLDAANPLSYPGSGTNWNDLTSYLNNGTLFNGPTFDSTNLGGFIFDGVDDYVDTTNLSNLSATTPFTLTAWVQSSGLGPVISCFKYAVPSSTNGAAGVEFSYQSGAFFLSIFDGSNDYLQAGSAFPSIYSNVNVFVTYDGSNDADNMKFYINGNLQGPFDGTYGTLVLNNLPLTQPFTYNIPWKIGTNSLAPNDIITPFTGTIYTAQVYNRVLSDQEILQNYEALKGRFGIF
jgi:hypothetical protein